MSKGLRFHVSRRAQIWAALVVIGLGPAGAIAGCKKSPVVEDRVITVHSLPACAVPSHAYGLFFGAGDFQPSAENSVNDGHFLDDLGAQLGLPQATRALTIDLFSSGESHWRGLADVASTGPVDVLAWPVGASCALPLALPSGPTLGVIDPQHLLIVSQNSQSLLVDLTTGSVTGITQDVAASRQGATITPFGDSTLVAGGEGDPRSADVLVKGAFDSASINLGIERQDHAAVVLVSGETLLVGGSTGLGLGPPEPRLTIVDPQSRRARSLGLDPLKVPRKNPTVLRLASGEILVAGGFDGAGKPVGTLEWLSADATKGLKQLDIFAAVETGFVALPGGGALAVVAPDLQNLPDAKDAKNVYLISADMRLQVATRITGALTKVRLFPGTNGSPLLWTGDRWLRWDPWTGGGEFTPFVEAQAASAAGDTVVSADNGLALWINRKASTIEGLRFSTRGAFATDPNPLFVDTTFLAPDRLTTSGAITFSPATGFALTLGSVFVADATFANFTLDLDAAPDRLPVVILRDPTGAQFQVGGATCPLTGTGTHLRVERDAAQVRVSLDGLPPTVCSAQLPSDLRVAIGLSGGISGPAATAQNLKIIRR